MRKDTLKYYSGHIFRGNGAGFGEGTVAVEDGRIVEDGPLKNFGSIDGVENIRNTIIAPLFFNAHTHLGDSFITDPPEGGLERMVIPPDGLKHQCLRGAERKTIGESILRELKFMTNSGTGFFCDYREGGIEGLDAMNIAKETANISGIDVPAGLVLGRPESGFDLSELKELLELSDGVGLSCLEDFGLSERQKITRAVRERGKLISAHLSEGARERPEPALECNAWPLIHLACATDEDLRKIAEAKLPVVVCPRSNLMFSLLPNVYRMIKAGVEIMVGTDNSFLTRPDMHAELDVLYRTFMHMNRGDIDGIAALYRSALGIPLLEFGRKNGSGSVKEKFQAGYEIAVKGFTESGPASYQALNNYLGATAKEIEYFLLNRASAMDIIDVSNG